MNPAGELKKLTEFLDFIDSEVLLKYHVQWNEDLSGFDVFSTERFEAKKDNDNVEPEFHICCIDSEDEDDEAKYIAVDYEYRETEIDGVWEDYQIPFESDLREVFMMLMMYALDKKKLKDQFSCGTQIEMYEKTAA